MNLYYTLLLALPLVAGDCFLLLPLGWTTPSSYTFQSQGWCQNQCAGYKYYALTAGSKCACGNTEPSDSTDQSECDTLCTGYQSENCGGSNAFNVQSNPQSEDAVVSSGGSLATSSSSLGSTSTITSSLSSLLLLLLLLALLSKDSTTAGSTTSAPTGTSESTYVQLVTLVRTQSGGGTHVVVVTAATGTLVATLVVSDTKNEDNQNNKAKLIGKIVGGVIGGLAALLILALAVFFIRRRRQKDRDLLDADANVIAGPEGPASGHTRQLLNPFADNFVETRPDFMPPPSEYYGYERQSVLPPTKLAVVNN